MRPEHWLYTIPLRLRSLFHRRQADEELNEELRDHVERKTEEYVAKGLAPEEARRQALVGMGGIEKRKEECRDTRHVTWLQDFAQDFRFALRMLPKSRGFTAVAVLSLALGIGANTAIFSLLNAVLLKPLPVKQPDSLVLFGDGRDCCISDAFPNTSLYSYPFYREVQKRNDVFSGVAAAYSTVQRVHGFIAGSADAEPMDVLPVSGTYFSVLGVGPIIGRALSEQDDATKDAHPVAVVSYGFWSQSLGRDPYVLKRNLTIGSTVFSIIGVAPPGFFGTQLGEQPDIWVPLSMQKKIPPGWDGYNDQMFESLNLIARLQRGVTPALAQADANLLFHQILHGFGAAPHTPQALQKLDRTHLELTSLSNGFSRVSWNFVGVLMAVVALVLLIACANVANLLLARATGRGREIAVRHALGAARSRLVRQLSTESLVLALGGGALGVALASPARHFLVHLVSTGGDIVRLDVPIDARVLLFALTITFATSILFGVIPALRATRFNIADSLRDGRNRPSAPAGTLAGRALVISQVALSLVLLVGAGLFLRSLVNLMDVHTGFNKENVILIRVDPSSAGYKEDARLAALYSNIQQRLAALPGVRAASFSLFTFNEGTWNNPIWVQGYLAGHQDIDVHHNVVGGDYFAAMGIPLLAGRAFSPQDTPTSPRVGIIGETLARTLFPVGSPIGRHYGRGGPDHAGDIEVIGVVKDVKYDSLDEPQKLGDYLPYTQAFRYLSDFQIRYAGDPRSLIPSVRETIHDVDRTLPISAVTTLEDQVSASIGNQRLVADLSAFFGLLAVSLACLGIYGLMSYAVTRRTHEIGIRMAVGAQPRDILRVIVGQGLKLLAVGVAVGLAASLALTRLMTSLLFGVTTTDPLTFASVGFLLFVVALTACYIPARRAMKVDPMVALRYE
ncbi:MAG TPA: ABC transporter permease [Candidatus Acidoferrales bacterium]|nr:ABC transporter permease [Candidatus Acidoferrales bacterium]